MAKAAQLVNPGDEGGTQACLFQTLDSINPEDHLEDDPRRYLWVGAWGSEARKGETGGALPSRSSLGNSGKCLRTDISGLLHPSHEGAAGSI